MGIAEWFSEFCANQRIGTDLRGTISYRTARITKQLNIDLRGLDSEVGNRFYVGSYGRGTAIRSVSDVDLLYSLPTELFAQYNAHLGNGQSALLAKVRSSIQKTYSATSIAGDGQVVVIAFNDGTVFELLPAFPNTDGGYTFADSNGGGSWRACKPRQEMDAFAARNSDCNGNLVELARMARAWRDYNNVPMGGMLIDTLAYQFIGSWAHRKQSYLYYDFMSRDFFEFLAGQGAQQKYWLAPGSGSYVYRSGNFEYKARQAQLRSLEAIKFDAGNFSWSARQKWREIYGSSFPS